MPAVLPALAMLLPGLAAGGGPQSALAPAGPEAEGIAHLFWVTATGALVIWAVVLALALHATRARRRGRVRAARLYVVVGGLLVPTLVLGGLLAWTFTLMAASPQAPALRVVVTGERWWWRVRYAAADGSPIELANELRLPTGVPVEFLLHSPEVIHSFWIPALGGKMDMIPGRVNRLTLRADRAGVYRGVCAEYCGIGHAHMAFTVEAMAPPAFAQWLEQQAAPATAPASARAAAGQRAFLASGCGACHAVRGTAARGVIGPDLTHLASRHTLGAGRLPLDGASLAHWIAHTAAVKPGVRMPSYPMLPQAERAAIATYLEGLR